MKILCVCDLGCNRSVHLAHPLKFLGHDTIPIGLANTSPETLKMLFKWADLILITEASQQIPASYQTKVRLFDVGPDRYPRPFNPELHRKVRQLIADHPLEVCQTK